MAARSRIRPAHWIVLMLCCWPRRGRWSNGLCGPAPSRSTAQAVAGGRELFNHEWTRQRPARQGRRARAGLQRQLLRRLPQPGGPRRRRADRPERHGLRPGSARPARFPRSGVVHQKAVRPEFQETLNLVHPGLPATPSIPLSELVDRTARRAHGRRRHPAQHAGPLRRRPDRRGPRRDPDRPQREHTDGRPPRRAQRGEGPEGPGADRPAGRRPARPLRLEAGIRHPRTTSSRPPAPTSSASPTPTGPRPPRWASATTRPRAPT